MKKLFLCILLLVSIQSYAQQDKGNGGDAVLVDGKWYLLDFVEAGNQGSENEADVNSKALTAFNRRLDEWRKSDSEAKKLILLNLVGFFRLHSHFPKALKEAVLAKMLDLYPSQRALYMVALMQNRWVFTPGELNDVADEDTVISNPRMQVAVRSRNQVQISIPALKKLDLYNQVGLIFHELTYTLVNPIKKPNGDWIQPSSDVRRINAELFHDLQHASLFHTTRISDGKEVPLIPVLAYRGENRNDAFSLRPASLDYVENTKIYYDPSIVIKADGIEKSYTIGRGTFEVDLTTGDIREILVADVPANNDFTDFCGKSIKISVAAKSISAKLEQFHSPFGDQSYLKVDVHNKLETFVSDGYGRWDGSFVVKGSVDLPIDIEACSTKLFETIQPVYWGALAVYNLLMNDKTMGALRPDERE